jgi:DNA-binding response OmpR family regulator
MTKLKSTPFLFVTAMNTAEHRLEGYEIGAEEFIPKPFHLKELLIRIRHVLSTHSAPQEITLGDRTLDLAAQAVVLKGGGREFFQARDFQLLSLLIQAAPRVVSRDEILDAVWGEDKFPSHRTVDNAIVRVRQLLGDTNASVIRSVRGVGYQWAPSLSKEE